MRQNKWAIIILTPVTIVALCVAWKLDTCMEAFWSNVFLGIFGSGLLTVFVSVINYLTERRKVLEAFWSYGHKAVRNLNRYSADDDLDTKIDTLLQMNEFDYQPFDDAYGDISFLIRHTKTVREIGNRIYQPICEVRETIAQHAYHFNLYKKAENGNRRVMEDFVSQIDALLIKRTSKSYPREDAPDLVVSMTETYKVHNLRLEFNNYFYKVMYPWKKVEDIVEEL